MPIFSFACYHYAGVCAQSADAMQNTTLLGNGTRATTPSDGTPSIEDALVDVADLLRSIGHTQPAALAILGLVLVLASFIGMGLPILVITYCAWRRGSRTPASYDTVAPLAGATDDDAHVAIDDSSASGDDSDNIVLPRINPAAGRDDDTSMTPRTRATVLAKWNH